jgi:hypothetical protein
MFGVWANPEVGLDLPKPASEVACLDPICARDPGYVLGDDPDQQNRPSPITSGNQPPLGIFIAFAPNRCEPYCDDRHQNGSCCRPSPMSNSSRDGPG